MRCISRHDPYMYGHSQHHSEPVIFNITVSKKELKESTHFDLLHRGQRSSGRLAVILVKGDNNRLSQLTFACCNTRSTAATHFPPAGVGTYYLDAQTCKGDLRCGNCLRLPGKSERKHFKLCGGCASIRYCSVACQAAHWHTHAQTWVHNHPLSKADRAETKALSFGQ